MADIELIIKIPEEIYEASQIIDVKYEDTVQIPLEVIANSTPLNKIRDEIRKKMTFNSFNEGYVLYDDITKVLDKYKAESEE